MRPTKNQVIAKKGRVISCALAATVGGLAAFYAYSVSSVSEPRVARAPVSIVMPVKSEDPAMVERALESLLPQLPEDGEIIVVTDDPIDVVGDPRIRVVPSPPGKLPARNLATELARNEVVVSVDADTIYPPGWLAAVVEPFRDLEVVGVAAPSNFFGNPLLDFLLYPGYVVVLSRKMSGRSSAYRKWAWEAVGRFDESRETDLRILMEEEEVNFMRKLRTVGKVVFVNAPAEHKGGFGMGRGLSTHLS